MDATAEAIEESWAVRLKATVVNNLMTVAQATASSIADWYTDVSGGVTLATGDAAEGTTCLVVTNPTAGANDVYNYPTVAPALTPGHVYTVTATVRSVQACTMQVNCLNEAIPTAVAVPAGVWTTLTYTFTATTAAAYLFVASYDSPAGNTIRYDKFGVWAGSGGSWALPGATLGTVSWYRSEGRDVFLGAGAVLVDRAPPLNVPILYYANDGVSNVFALPVTVVAEQPVLSSTTSNTAAGVDVISFRPYRGEGRSVWHPVIGRSDPFVSIFPALYPGGTLKLRCATNDERLNIVQSFLQPGAPLLLRTTCPDRLDTMTFLMTSWSDPFPDDSMRGGPTYLEISFQRVTEVAPAFVPPVRTYQNVIDGNATYAVVLTKYDSYQALLDGIVTPA